MSAPAREVLVPLEEARRIVLDACHPLRVEEVVLADAFGAALATGVVATEPVPPFASTAMDGYALRALDTAGAPVELEVTGVLAAGASPDLVIAAGEAVRIMTGAAIPAGADAVVQVERSAPGGSATTVTIEVEARPGDNIRPAGEDVSAGETVFEPGEVLTAAHLGVLASLGRKSVAVHRRPRVGILSTGDELAAPDAPLAPGQIRDANRPSLGALVTEAGCEPIDLGVVRDDEDALAQALDDAVRDCDVILTSGGVSVGDFDYVKVVLDRLGDMRWMQVAVKPGKPFAFGTVGDVVIFGLPGNPASAMVSFECFARPALRKMLGYPPARWWRPRVTGIADEAFGRHPDGKLHFVRVVAVWHETDRQYHVGSAGRQNSNLLRSMARANALGLVPDGSGVAAGAEIDLLLLGPVLSAPGV